MWKAVNCLTWDGLMEPWLGLWFVLSHKKKWPTLAHNFFFSFWGMVIKTMSLKQGKIWSYISSMLTRVPSPDERLRRELKIRRASEYFWQTSRCFISWGNTASNAWYYFSNKMSLYREIKDAKMSSFSSDFQTLIKH